MECTACGECLIEEISMAYSEYPHTEGTFTVECPACEVEFDVEVVATVDFDLIERGAL